MSSAILVLEAGTPHGKGRETEFFSLAPLRKGERPNDAAGAGLVLKQSAVMEAAAGSEEKARSWLLERFLKRDADGKEVKHAVDPPCYFRAALNTDFECMWAVGAWAGGAGVVRARLAVGRAPNRPFPVQVGTP